MKIVSMIDAQAAGWRIEEVETDSCRLACPREGCSVRVTWREGDPVPACSSAAGPGLVIASHEDFRLLMRAERERLALTISEVEDAAGLSTSHLLKAEKDDPSRVVNLDTAIDWASALGGSLVVVFGPMPVRTLRIVAETREDVSRRRIINETAQARRDERRQRPVESPRALPRPPAGLPLYRKAARLGG